MSIESVSEAPPVSRRALLGGLPIAIAAASSVTVVSSSVEAQPLGHERPR